MTVTEKSSEDNALYKRLSIFLSPAGMSLTKLTLAGKSLISDDISAWGQENR